MDTTSASVSIVVPVFNGGSTIASCLDSLLDLNFPPDRFEIVVVDNASTDDTLDILANYEGKVRLLSETTRGPAAARNTGVRQATGDIIAFTDADCTVDRDWLEHLTKPLNEDDIGIVGGEILSRRPSTGIEQFDETIHNHRMAIEVFRPPYAITMNWASPRQLLLDVDLFDESFVRCEDVDLSQRILQRGQRMVYQREAVVYHRNESTLPGLFREGFQHGVWAVKHNKQHHHTHRRSGHRRVNFQSFLEMGANFIASMDLGNDSQRRLHARCQAIFDSGKKLGKIIGSVRFGYLDL